jgi:hypothetical protein
MLKRRERGYRSSSSSAAVNKSKSSVATAESCSFCATYLFRRLKRLLPLPCANNTSPMAPSGKINSPSRRTPPEGMKALRTTLNSFLFRSLRFLLPPRRGSQVVTVLTGASKPTSKKPLSAFSFLPRGAARRSLLMYPPRLHRRGR